MKPKRFIVATATMALMLVLAWGCQNAKPVGPMKYISMKASVSTKGLVKASYTELPFDTLLVLYRVTGPSMNPVSGSLTISSSEPRDVAREATVKASGIFPDTVNFSIDVPAGPSRVLAVEVKGSPTYMTQGVVYDPTMDVLGIGAVKFDVDPGTQVVNVPVTIGEMCWYDIQCWESYYFCSGDFYFPFSNVAYMGKTDLVNCAYVPDLNAFTSCSDSAKNYFYTGEKPEKKLTTTKAEGPYIGLEAGDAYCLTDYYGGHYWLQVVDRGEGCLSFIWRYNTTQPYYGYQDNGCSGPVDSVGLN
jgi:hypothetical protein